jgi:alpha-glucosidase
MRFGLQPHHDGSPLYLPVSAPSLGDRFEVRVHVPTDARCDEVWVRTVADGEPWLRPMEVDGEDASGSWFRGLLTARHAVTPYRFVLLGGSVPYRVLNGTGVHVRDVSDAFDFRVSTASLPPAWVAESVAYQIFPDRFACTNLAWQTPAWATRAEWDDPVDSVGDTAVTQVFGGDLDGVVQHLDHLVDLGVNLIYFTPIFPAESSHRYNASTFDRIDDLLGGDAAMARLTAAAHERGIKVLMDITTNHTGDTHEWFQTALADSSSPERDFYYFNAGTNEYVAWYDIATLPKLNFGSQTLRARLLTGEESVTAKWMKPPYSIDGWRVDVATMTGRQEADDYCGQVARDMRETMAAITADSYLLAEHNYDASADLMGDGWHGTMNYAGFTNPILSWLSPDTAAATPRSAGRLAGPAVVETIREISARMPWRSLLASFTLLGSHDTARVASLLAPDAQRVGVGLLMSLPGVPMIFAGDEIGLKGANDNAARQPFPWNHRDRWDDDLYEWYRATISQRHQSPALQSGSLRWLAVTDDALVFLRELPEERVLVQAARAAHDSILISGIGTVELQSLHGTDHRPAGPSISLQADGPMISMWRLI